MNPLPAVPTLKSFSKAFLFATLFCFFPLIGCGTVAETNTPSQVPYTVTARLEYRVDSLMTENRRLKQQIDVIATENRNLNARNAELELRLKEPVPVPVPKPAPVVTPQAPAVPSGDYSDALALYRKRDFAGAIHLFEQLINGGVSGDLVDNCYYWIGESNYGLGKYSVAIENFQKVLASSRSSKKDDAQMMLANSYVAMGDKAAARDAYNKLIANFPSSPFVKSAKSKLSSLK